MPAPVETWIECTRCGAKLRKFPGAGPSDIEALAKEASEEHRATCPKAGEAT